ncbi:OLC1v1025930C1 [Oldenlandia corymbosa var. corymbosa]|uniref:OLC1v1025930C1 n=1 Tax=Oldenlandia corymbosa var. corymbosa TaxID=529605 RepID=A0AAV1C6I9_OLDCO|nr:OLC1v1025930C1 [Oldenlandia corymbosa var. corymbosa]
MDGKKLCLILHLFAILFVPMVAGVEPAFYRCDTNKNFTTGSPYDKHLRILLRTLYFKTPATGYEFVSVEGENEPVYGSALCRGGVSPADCRTCLLEAVAGIQRSCSFNIAGNIWYEHCSLTYSDIDFFGHPFSTGYLIRSEYDVSSSLSSKAEIGKFLNQLSDEASASKKLFARAVAELEESSGLKVFGLVQCALDISSSNCADCIHDRINDLLFLYDGKGAQIVSVTCNVRIEFFPFFQT